jgi:cell division protein FtsB
MRIIIIFLILILLGLQYKLWLGDGSFLQWQRLENKLKAIQVNNTNLTARNAKIAANIVELQSGDQALEEEARNELGMIKDGEIYYHTPD